MPEYMVDVEEICASYTHVTAESKEEAIRLVESGDYEDLYGGDFRGIKVISVNEVTE